MQVLRCLFVG